MRLRLMLPGSSSKRGAGGGGVVVSAKHDAGWVGGATMAAQAVLAKLSVCVHVCVNNSNSHAK